MMSISTKPVVDVDSKSKPCRAVNIISIMYHPDIHRIKVFFASMKIQLSLGVFEAT